MNLKEIEMQSRIDKLKALSDVLSRLHNCIAKRENIPNVNYFTVTNTVKIDDGDINILFPLYLHGYSGVRDAIEKLNALHNSNTGDGLVVIYSPTQSAFYLLFKNLQSFIDAINTLYEELKGLYTCQMYTRVDEQNKSEYNEP